MNSFGGTAVTALAAAVATAVATVAGGSPATANVISPAGCRTWATDWSSGSFWSENCWVGNSYINNANFVAGAQHVLAGSGKYGGSIDNSFGTGTFNGVKAFQTWQGITSDGVVGPTTWDRMRGELLFRGSDAGWEYLQVSVEESNNGNYNRFRRNASTLKYWVWSPGYGNYKEFRIQVA